MCSSLCPKCPSPRKPHDSLPLLLQILPGTLLIQGNLSHLCLLTLFITHFLGFFFSIPLISLSPYVLFISILYGLSPQNVGSLNAETFVCYLLSLRFLEQSLAWSLLKIFMKCMKDWRTFFYLLVPHIIIMNWLPYFHCLPLTEWEIFK